MARAKHVAEQTIVILDVETGSVGAALGRLSAQEPPRLFAETRVPMPMQQTLGAEKLARSAERAAREALIHTSTVAARLRATSNLARKSTPSLGEVEEAIVFLTPPWSTLVAGARGAVWRFEPTLTAALAAEIEAVFGNIPVTFHAFGKAASHTTGALFPQQPYILCALMGELSELALVEANRPAAWASVPLGSNTVLRTLQSHAGLSEAEARSALRFGHDETTPAYAQLEEPFLAAAAHSTKQFKDASAELLGDKIASGILVVGNSPAADWFARTLAADPSLLELFPQGGVVRPLRRSHLAPYIAGHAPEPDLMLMLEILSVVYT